MTHSGVSRLMGLHYRSSHRRPFAIPAGQGGLRKHYIARRKLVCIFEESPPSVPINKISVLHYRVFRLPINYSIKHIYEIDSFNIPPPDLVELKVTDSAHFWSGRYVFLSFKK